jgi:hypothetical protein
MNGASALKYTLDVPFGSIRTTLPSAPVPAKSTLPPRSTASARTLSTSGSVA